MGLNIYEDYLKAVNAAYLNGERMGLAFDSDGRTSTAPLLFKEGWPKAGVVAKTPPTRRAGPPVLRKKATTTISQTNTALQLEAEKNKYKVI